MRAQDPTHFAAPPALLFCTCAHTLYGRDLSVIIIIIIIELGVAWNHEAKTRHSRSSLVKSFQARVIARILSCVSSVNIQCKKVV
jgi:hypothetical protein